jgi:DNA-binding LacI/PurR family transcriptional regulator
VCDTDFTAAGLLRAFRRLGIRVPDDIAVLGWGDLQFAGVFDPRISTVTLQLPDLLNRVVERLHRQLSGDEGSGGIELVPSKLLVRETT